MKPLDARIAVVGLGYVGLPLAVAMGQRFDGVVGYDLNSERVAELRAGTDSTREVTSDELACAGVAFTTTTAMVALQEANVYIIAVPTPVDSQKRPDLGPLRRASQEVGALLRPGDMVVYESTVYPGATEEVCVPILSEASGLSTSEFSVGYSPERINPGDAERSFATIKKVVSTSSPEALDRVSAIYGAVVDAGIHRAPTIRVAEACKVVENIQRDVNIALVNELAVIFDRLGMRSSDVFDAAATKWNWLSFHPGLVGGHCIGVDPYYMAAKAEEVGVAPQVIMSGRRINDSMGAFVGQRVVREMALAGLALRHAKVLILGAAFKPNIGDVRNSKSFDVGDELKAYGCDVAFYDPHVDELEIRQRGFRAVDEGGLLDLVPDAVVLAVPHDGMAELVRAKVTRNTGSIRVLADLHGVVGEDTVSRAEDGNPTRVRYWRL
jgi:UDP-N-acetyl-D-galactosamine dehydrogenase